MPTDAELPQDAPQDPQDPGLEEPRSTAMRGQERNLLNTISLLVIAAVAGTAALIYTRSVMVPFVLALLISYLVTPMVDVLQLRLKVPRFLAMLAAFLVIVGGLSVLVLLLITSIGGLADNVQVYQARFVDLATWASSLLDRYDIDLGQEEVAASLGELPLQVLGWLKSTAGGVFSFLSTTFLVLIFVIYLIIGHKPAEQRRGLWEEVDSKIRLYLATKLGTSAVTGLLVGIILWALGVDLALVFGVMAFLLNFIPSIGSVIATLLPLPIALMQFDSPWRIALVFLLPGAVQMAVGNGIEPKIMGDSLDLHPVTILLALIFWGLVWGPVGMLLAAPSTAVLKIIMERFETTRPAADLLAGRLPEL